MEKEIYWFEREVAAKTQNSLFIFIKEYHEGNGILTIGSRAYQLFNKFICESFKMNRNHRYSVSKLSEVLSNSGIVEKDNRYLIIRYIDSLYLLAEENNEKEFLI